MDLYVISKPTEQSRGPDGEWETKIVEDKAEYRIHVQVDGVVKSYDGNGKIVEGEGFDDDDGFGLDTHFSQQAETEAFEFAPLTSAKKKMLKDEYGINA